MSQRKMHVSVKCRSYFHESLLAAWQHLLLSHTERSLTLPQCILIGISNQSDSPSGLPLSGRAQSLSLRLSTTHNLLLYTEGPAHTPGPTKRPTLCKEYHYSELLCLAMMHALFNLDDQKFWFMDSRPCIYPFALCNILQLA